MAARSGSTLNPEAQAFCPKSFKTPSKVNEVAPDFGMECAVPQDLESHAPGWKTSAKSNYRQARLNKKIKARSGGEPVYPGNFKPSQSPKPTSYPTMPCESGATQHYDPCKKPGHGSRHNVWHVNNMRQHGSKAKPRSTQAQLARGHKSHGEHVEPVHLYCELPGSWWWWSRESFPSKRYQSPCFVSGDETETGSPRLSPGPRRGGWLRCRQTGRRKSCGQLDFKKVSEQRHVHVKFVFLGCVGKIRSLRRQRDSLSLRQTNGYSIKNNDNYGEQRWISVFP